MIPVKVLSHIRFIFSLFSCVVVGFEMAFNVYALPLRETFNMTQTQVEVVASMNTAGLVTSFLETLVTYKCGYIFTTGLVLVIVPVSSTCFGLVVLYKNIIGELCFPIICAIQFILSAGMNVAFLVVTRVSIEHFSSSQTGKVIALFMAAVGAGKIFFGGLMELFFFQNLGGYFFTLSFLSFFCFGGALSFHNYLSSTTRRTEAENDTKKNQSNSDRVNNNYSSEQDSAVEDGELSQKKELIEKEDSTVRDLLKSPFFQVTFWSAIFVYACSFTSLNSITSIAQSAYMPRPMQSVYIISVSIIFFRILNGVLFDKFPSEMFGFGLLLVAYGAFIVAMVIGIFWLNPVFMYPTTILIGMEIAPGMTIPVSIILKRFGRSHYSAVTGAFYALMGVSQIAIQLITGYFYDSQSRKTGISSPCYGRQCFYVPFIIMLTITTTVFAVQFVSCLCLKLKSR